MSNFKVFMNGLVKENPTFVLLLGMCPTLGTTSSAFNGMSMGLATTAVLVLLVWDSRESLLVLTSVRNM